MQYRTLGRSGLQVSAICLGTLQCGWWIDEAVSRQVLDDYVAGGGNFIDTADVYPTFGDGIGGRAAEEIVGRWLKSRGRRDQIVLATKVGGRMGPGPNEEGLSRRHILGAAEDSLRRLQTDHIDLYQAHDDDLAVPIEETLSAFDALIRRGLVRYIGCSNIQAWRLMKALTTSERHNFAAYISVQASYNLIDRHGFERELGPLCLAEGIGVLPYTPLAKGFLSGRYRSDARPPETPRAPGVSRLYQHERGWRILDAVRRVARRHSASPTRVSLAWLLRQPSVVAPVVGASSPQQIADILGCVALTLDAEDMVELNADPCGSIGRLAQRADQAEPGAAAGAPGQEPAGSSAELSTPAAEAAPASLK